MGTVNTVVADRYASVESIWIRVGKGVKKSYATSLCEVVGISPDYQASVCLENLSGRIRSPNAGRLSLYQLPCQVLISPRAEVVCQGHDPRGHCAVFPVKLCSQGVPVTAIVFRVWSPVPCDVPDPVSLCELP